MTTFQSSPHNSTQQHRDERRPEPTPHSLLATAMPTTPAKDPNGVERTLAVLYGPEQVDFRAEVEERIMQAGFLIVAEGCMVAEELEEAGLDVDEIRERGEDVVHVALALERKSAVAVWKELMGEGRNALNKDS